MNRSDPLLSKYGSGYVGMRELEKTGLPIGRR